MNLTNYKDFFRSKLFRRILWTLAIIVVALTIFQAGIFMGYRKASFSYRLGDNYERMFGIPPHPGMMSPGDFLGFPHGEFTSEYGTTGTIIKINLPTIIVEGNDKIEKVVTVNGKTIIRQFRNDISAQDLNVGESVVVIGSPNSAAQIEAKLIRILPPNAGAPTMGSAATTTNN